MKLIIDLDVNLSQEQLKLVYNYVNYTSESFNILSGLETISLVCNAASFKIHTFDLEVLTEDQRELLDLELWELELHIKNFLDDLFNTVQRIYLPSYTIKEASKRLNRTPRHIQRLCQEGVLQAVKLRNNQWRIWGHSILELCSHRSKKI